MATTSPELTALLVLSNAHKRDSWASFGSITIVATIRSIARKTLFVLNAPGTPLDQYVLFTTADINETSNIDWANYTLNDATDGTIINATIINPYIYAILNPTDRAAIVDPVDTTFKPFENIYAIEITEEELNKIMIDVGFPFVTWDDIEFTKEQILQLCVFPAMEEYFKFFPKIRTESYTVVQSRFDIPMPSYAFKAARAWITPGYPGSSIGNPIVYYFDEVLMSINARGSFAHPQNNFMAPQKWTDIQGYNTYLLDRAARQGVANHSSRVRMKLQHSSTDNSMHLVGFSSKLGLLHVDWAIMSTLWEDVPYNRKTEVRDLARAYVLRALGMLRSQVRNDAIGTINSENFIARADVLELKVVENWKSFTKCVIIRGT